MNNTPRHIYFLGIGGIGMSALARHFLRQGLRVSGYDRTASVVTRALEAEGAAVYYEQDPAHLAGVDEVIYTPAVKMDNIELQAATAQGLPLRKRAYVLGEICNEHRTLAVAGTHGKTTTSTLLTHLLRAGGVDATAFLGGLSRNLPHGNYVWGDSGFLVAEADEFDRSFLTLQPEMAVITSLDPDHLDIYGDAASMQAAYIAFAAQVKQRLLVQHELLGASWPQKPLSYGIGAGDYRADALRFGELSTSFDFTGPRMALRGLSMPFPGRHNVLNATAALAIAAMAGADMSRMRAALADFAGIYRRFEVQLHTASLSYVDDYAHHPAEIEAAIRTARDLFPERQLIVLFQPHLFTRTRDFAGGFAAALSAADQLLLMDIYPAREQPIPGVSSAMLLEQSTCAHKTLVNRSVLIAALDAALQLPSVLLSLGAGDIDREVDRIREWAVQRSEKIPFTPNA